VKLADSAERGEVVSSEAQGGLIIFTLDALINPPRGYTTRAYHRWQILPGREWKLRQLAKTGWVIGVVSNQDLVALGYVADGDFRHKIERLGDLLGVTLDYRVCYAHLDATLAEFRDPNGLSRRLPGQAMLIELMTAHPAEMQRGTMFVALLDDAAAARAASVDFMTASAFFGE
jgi:histidinol phosphatase-like enzyme